MDARGQGFGLVTTMPRSRTSFLGDIIYINDEGEVGSIANIFNSAAQDRSMFGGRLLENPQKEHIRFEGKMVAVTTAGLQAETLTKEECERYSQLLFLVQFDAN